MQLIGHNFQSWEDFSLDISGLTVVIGPSNLGKSAIFRSLRGLFRNEISAEYIRNGTENLSLTANFDGHSIIATRTPKGSTKYQIDGETFKKLNQKVPKELSAFGFNPISVGEFEADPIFATQFDTPFMLSCGPNELNAILGAFASTEKLEAGKKSANLQITQKNSEAKALAVEVAEAEERKAALTTLDADMNEVARELRRLDSEVFILETKTEWLRAAEHRQTYLWPLKHVLKTLVIPDISEVEALAVKTDMAIQATNSFRLKKIFSRATASVDEVADAYLRVFGQLDTLTTIYAVIELHSRCAPAYQVVTDLLSTVSNLEQEVVQFTRIERTIAKMREILDLRNAVVDIPAKMQRLDEDLATLNRELSDLQRKGEREDAQKIECPQCGFKFHMEGAHA